MPVDPLVRQLLDTLAASGAPPMWAQPVDEARADYRAVVEARRGRSGPPPAVGRVVDMEAAGPAGEVPLRVYSPTGGPGGGRPAIVFFHGGGWVVGDLDTHDAVCRTLCAEVAAVVVSVGYRLAPEHRFPAAVDDGVAALAWVAANAARLGVRPDRLAVAGDSAGANLATVVARLAMEAGGPPVAAQALVYPVTDATLSFPSIQENGTGYYLEAATMRWFLEHYAPDESTWADPRLSPLVADLAGLPPAVVATAQYDPLRDEGDAYAERLRAAGVRVVHRRYDGQIHGFFGMGPLVPSARAAVAEICADLRELLR
ncbi:MAG: alpha/beta hydrolase [Actinomycetota bacterium]|nr:alpha/beta hydrolase [Actinomycetota bacterium]